jgi:hypothetical protein
VVSGIVVLIALLLVLILGLCWCLHWQRQRRKDRAEDAHPLVEPLIGENPMYMDHAMGTHVEQQPTRDYHQFSNPLYALSSTSQAGPAGAMSSSPLYAYPSTRQSRLLASVYLPGDNSPLTGSLSSQGLLGGSPCHSQGSQQQPARDREGSCLGEGHYDVIRHPPPSSNLNPLDPRPSLAPASGGERHRNYSISSQYFHLPPDSHL